MSTPHPPYRLLLGSCPDSWGVWFADDPRQTPWSRFLDELAEVGYRYLELGPYGYLPTDPARLRDEVGRRGLTVTGGTVAGHSGLHRPGDFGSILAATRQVAGLTAAMGARHVIFVPVPGYRDDVTGAYLEDAELDADGWRTLIASANEIGRQIAQDYGVRLQFHPHADSHACRPSRRSSGFSPIPTRSTCRCAWTPVTWPTAARTAWRSSPGSPPGSATCTSSRWTGTSWPRLRRRTWPSAAPSRWARAVSHRTACRTSRPSSPPWRNWARNCTRWWSRTCTRVTSASPSRSRRAPIRI